MKRDELVRTVSERLGTLRLVYFGTRGDDVEAVAGLPQLEAAFSIISAYRRRSTVESMALEDITGERVDLDTFDIDDDPRSEAMVRLRRALLRVLARPSAVFTYRPSTFVSAACFARGNRCRYLGLFNGLQAAFEHKPWVETEVAALGIPHIPWTYVADDDQLETLRFLGDGPVMLRRSRTTGGVGLVRVDDPDELAALWPKEDEAFVSVAPYIGQAVPVNVSGVVWCDGVTVHPASVQLIGVPGCTTRPFGYCGNDFGALAQFSAGQIDAIELATVTVGSWLGGFGYRGAFGIDFLVDERGVPLFTEVNPRFQGSTHLTCEMAVRDGRSCLLLEHLAALLDVSAPPRVSLRDWMTVAGSLAHFVVHWPGAEGAAVDPGPLVAELGREPQFRRADVLTRSALRTGKGATVARVTVDSLLTTTGFELAEPWSSTVLAWSTAAEERSETKESRVGE